MKTSLNYLVGYTGQASKYEKPFERIIASFETYSNAEDFINKCMPEETRSRFFIRLNEQ